MLSVVHFSKHAKHASMAFPLGMIYFHGGFSILVWRVYPMKSPYKIWLTHKWCWFPVVFPQHWKGLGRRCSLSNPWSLQRCLPSGYDIHSLPWKIHHAFNKPGKPSISMGHLYHGYVSHNQRVTFMYVHTCTWSIFGQSKTCIFCWFLGHVRLYNKKTKEILIKLRLNIHKLPIQGDVQTWCDTFFSIFCGYGYSTNLNFRRFLVFVGRPPDSWAALWKDSTDCQLRQRPVRQVDPQRTMVSTCIPLWWGRSHDRNGLVSWSQKFDPTQNHAALLDSWFYHHLGLTPQFSDTCKSSWISICVICIYIYIYIWYVTYVKKIRWFWLLKAEYCAKPVLFLGYASLRQKKTYDMPLHHISSYKSII